MRHRDVIGDLRRSYDQEASDRSRFERARWKHDEREAFAARLRPAARLLELGAGTGQDSAFFGSAGFDVVATDASAAMVEHCRDRGIEARVVDMAALDLPAESFDAAYAMNCLLHIPNADLPTVLEGIRTVLRPGGLFYLGVYGGTEREGFAENDWHRPPRFFSMRTDEQIQAFARESFEIVDFHVLELDNGDRFQSLTLRRS